MAVLGLCFCARAFSSCGERGPLFIAVRGPLTIAGLSCCGAQAPDAQAQQLWLTGLVAPRHVGSSQTRARTRVPRIGRQILNHCATRETLIFFFYNSFFLGKFRKFYPAFSFFSFLKYLFIYLFLIFGCVGSLLVRVGFLQLWRAGTTLRCDAQASHCGGFSCCGSRALGVQALEHRLSSCGARAQLFCGMWDLPRPGLKPVSPALAGGFLTTVPPGKSCPAFLISDIIHEHFFLISLNCFTT